MIRAIWALLIGSLIFGQTADRVAFEVASVKPSPNAPGSGLLALDFPPGGRFAARNVSIIFILERIYQVRNFQIVGDSSTLAMTGFRGGSYDIDAKGDPSASEQQVREMVKTLLADRFKLKLHKETRGLPVYALIPAKSGVKLQATKNPDGRRDQLASRPAWIEGTNDSAEALAILLTELADRPVLDKTGIGYRFDFRLTWTPDSPAITDAPHPDGGCPPSVTARAANKGIKEALSCPSLFTAEQEQLGLRLDPQKAPVDVLVIDQVGRPSGN